MLAQTVWSVPASTIGAGLKEIVIWSLTAKQPFAPWSDDVRVSVTLPFAISVAVGVYEAFRSLLSTTKVPKPLVQVPALAPPLTFPDKTVTALFAPFVWSIPALTTGAEEKVIVILSLTSKQFPLPVLVTIRVTVPFAISADEGE